MTCITESDFIARVEGLITELACGREADGDLQFRWNETLIEGYGRALALEGRRRRLRERQLALADLPEPDAGALRQLTAFARSEARLGRQEHELRLLLAALRGALAGLAGAADHEMIPRRSA
jgi:hypothetical protein